LMLAVPVVMMENAGIIASLRRSTILIRRSLRTAFAAFLLMFLIPAIMAGFLSSYISFAARAIDPEGFGAKPAAAENVAEVKADEDGPNFSISIGEERIVTTEPAPAPTPASPPEPQNTRQQVKVTLVE